MIQLTDLAEALADMLFSGNVGLAGLCIFAIVLCIIFAIGRNMFMTLIISIPVALIFTGLNLLNEEIMIILVVVAVLGLAYSSRQVWSD